MLDMNVIYSILIVIAVIGFTKYVMPYLKKNNLELYEEIKLALLLCGYSFRDEKVKAIINTTMDLVTDLETISIAPEDKLDVVVSEVSKKLIKESSIELDDEVLGTIVNVVVSTLPATNTK